MWHLLAGAAVTVYDRKLKETIHDDDVFSGFK